MEIIVGFENYCFPAPKLCRTQFLFSNRKFRVPVPPPTSHKAAPSLHCPPHTKQSFTPTTQPGVTFARPPHKHTHLSPALTATRYVPAPGVTSGGRPLPISKTPRTSEKPVFHTKQDPFLRSSLVPLSALSVRPTGAVLSHRSHLGPVGSSTQRFHDPENSSYRPVSKARLEPPTPADLPAAEAKSASPPQSSPPCFPRDTPPPPRPTRPGAPRSPALLFLLPA